MYVYVYGRYIGINIIDEKCIECISSTHERHGYTSVIDEGRTECISLPCERHTGCICLYAFGALGQSIKVVCSTFPFHLGLFCFVFHTNYES